MALGEVIAEAQKLTGIKARPELNHEALVALVSREKARRLAKLGGSDPELKPSWQTSYGMSILVGTSIWIDHFNKGDPMLMESFMSPAASMPLDAGQAITRSGNSDGNCLLCFLVIRPPAQVSLALTLALENTQPTS